MDRVTSPTSARRTYHRLIAETLDGRDGLGLPSFTSSPSDPLINAVRQGQQGTVVALLRQGARPDARSGETDTAIHVAASLGNSTILRQLLFRYRGNVDLQGEMGRTPLHLACLNGRPRNAGMLVAKGASLKVADGRGLTPKRYALAWAAQQRLMKVGAKQSPSDEVLRAMAELDPERFKELVKCQRDANKQHAGGATLLHLLVKQGGQLQSRLDCLSQGVASRQQATRRLAINRQMMGHLLSLEPNYLAQDQKKRTALHEAVESVNVWAVASLCSGAKQLTHVCDSEGHTPLSRAVPSMVNERGEQEWSAWFDTLALEPIAVKLVQHGSDPNPLDSRRRSVFHRALENGFLQLARLMVDHGALASPLDSSYGEILAQRAATSGQWKIVQLLAEARLDPNLKLKVTGGQTLSLLACAIRHKLSVKAVQVLIGNRAVIGPQEIYEAGACKNKEIQALVRPKKGSSKKMRFTRAFSGLVRRRSSDLSISAPTLKPVDAPEPTPQARGPVPVAQPDNATPLPTEVIAPQPWQPQPMPTPPDSAEPPAQRSKRKPKPASPSLTPRKADPVPDWKTLLAAVNVGDAAAIRAQRWPDELLNRKKNPPFVIAVMRCNKPPGEGMGPRIGVVKALLDQGADPNARGAHGWTGLHLAAVYQRVDAVTLLLQRGASPTQRDDDGNRALDYALQKPNQEIQRLLQGPPPGLGPPK